MRGGEMKFVDIRTDATRKSHVTHVAFCLGPRVNFSPTGVQTGAIKAVSRRSVSNQLP